jgi:hypothetical protein
MKTADEHTTAVIATGLLDCALSVAFFLLLAFPFHREVNLCEFKSSGMDLRREQLVNKERNLDLKLRQLRFED